MDSHSPLSPSAAFWVILAGAVVLAVAASWLLGVGVGSDIEQLDQRLPEALRSVRDYLRTSPVSPLDALYAALLYVAVQQIEGNLITPLIQRQAVHVQPALLILAIIAFGVIFGILGVIFGAPLTVVVLVLVLVQKLYLEG